MTSTPSKTNEETEVFAVVLKAEVVANGWTGKDLICLAVDGKDAGKQLVEALRRHELHVCSEAEWRRNFSCGFGVLLEPVKFESSEAARVWFSSADYREIKKGEGDLAIRLRQGEYSLRKTDGRWSIAQYTPDEHDGTNQRSSKIDHFPMQKLLKIKFRMSSVVVSPVIASSGRRAP
jgi:hypothetical protein